MYYCVQFGQFVNIEDLCFVDWKQFCESDFILYFNFLCIFQMLDIFLVIINLYFELYFIYYFNGVIINNILFLKKIWIKMVVGGGVFWFKDGDYCYQEVFVGIE